MNEKKKQIRRLRRIKILDEFLIAFSTNKIMLKNLVEDKHYTFSVLGDKKKFDIHETLEGKKKSYDKGTEFDFEELIESSINFKVALYSELLKRMVEIDINNSKFSDIEVYIPNDEAFEVKGRTMILGHNQLNNALLPVNLKNDDFKIAFTTIDEKEHILLKGVLKGVDRYFLLSLDDLTELLVRYIEEYYQFLDL